MFARRLLVVLAAAAVAPSAALAHKLELKATLPAGRPVVVVEAWYEGDEPGDGAKVVIARADNGAVVAEGTADDKGVCTLPRPTAGAYAITATDAGHRAAVPLTIDDAPAADAVTVQTPGYNRYLTTAAGLAVIAAGTVITRRLIRKQPAPT